MIKQWTLPECCPACGAVMRPTNQLRHLTRGYQCIHNQLVDYKRALEMVCDPDEAERRLAAARAARLGGK